MTAFELKRVFLFQSVHQLAGIMLPPVIQGTQLLLASFFLMIATVFPFQRGVSSKDITGKFYILIVKKSRRKLVKIIRSVELATKKNVKASMLSTSRIITVLRNCSSFVFRL